MKRLQDARLFGWQLLLFFGESCFGDCAPYHRLGRLRQKAGASGNVQTGVGVAPLEAKKEDVIEESEQSLGMERRADSTPAPAVARMSNLP